MTGFKPRLPKLMKELLLARSFIWSQTEDKVHASYLVSVVGVVVGVTFLILTVGVYDSYVKKLETITFSVYPHILVLDGQRGGDAAPSAPAPVNPRQAEKERCDRICQGQRILNPDQAESAGADDVTSASRLRVLEEVVGELETRAEVAPLIMAERDFSCRFESGAGQSTQVQRFRVLGVQPTTGLYVPQVDLFVPRRLLGRLADAGRPSVIVSEALADSLFATTEVAGRTITIDGIGENPLVLTVLGSFSLGFHSISRNMVITSIATAQTLLDMQGKASYFGISLRDPYTSRRALAQLRGRLRRQSFRASDWMSIAGGDFASIRLFRWILFLVLGMSFIITALSIRNTLTIMTVERQRQIGILRALGLRDVSIRAVFVLIAVSIGLLGSLIGLLLGSVLSLHFGHWLDEKLVGFLPIHGVEMTFHPVAMAQVLSLVLLVCLITALLSVNRALHLDPVTCLTEE